MRFLNITINIPGKADNKKLSFTGESNIIKAPDRRMGIIASQMAFIGMYGKCSGGENPVEVTGNEDYSILIESEINGKPFTFSCKNGSLQKQGESSVPLFDIDDFTLYSFSEYDYPDGAMDPVLYSKNLKSFFINREDDKEIRKNPLYPEKEKALNELNKKKQLLQLKKMKKDKLKKEINSSERELGKLLRKKESFESYKKTLNELQKMTQDNGKLSSKINSLKKDIIELRETQSKGEDLEKELADRFPQFNINMIDKIPDLDILQNQFNTIRDINEQIDKFYSGKNRKKSLAVKSISGLLLFSLIAFIFLSVKWGKMSSGASLFLGILSTLSLLISAAAGYYILFILKKLHPEELQKRKTLVEKGLLDIFKSVNFPVKNFATGELYEYLFQYFEDFLSFRELQSELSSIKKRFSSSSILEEKEDKLESIILQKEEMDKEINYKLTLLDTNIHPTPSINEIHTVMHEIDEMISDNNKETSHKSSIAEKIMHEAKQYESGDMQDSAIDEMIAEIDTVINKYQNEIKDIRLKKQVFHENSDAWFEDKLKALSVKSAENYIRITGSDEEKEQLSSSIKKLINTGKLNSFDADSLKLLALSVRLALPEVADSHINPLLILREPFQIPGNEIVDNIKKILLELSEKRQVLIITSADAKNLTGNLINI